MLLKQIKRILKKILIIRGKELDAKRDSLIRMKEKKYDRDLIKYDADKKRIDSLTSLKAAFSKKREPDGTLNKIDAATYGKSFIMETKGAAEVKNIMATFKTAKRSR